MFGGKDAVQATLMLLGALVLIALAAFVWRNAAREGVYKFSARYWLGLLLGCVAFVFAGAALQSLTEIAGAYPTELPRDLTFLAPVQQAGSFPWKCEMGIRRRSECHRLALAGVFALIAWAYAWLAEKKAWTIIIDVAFVGDADAQPDRFRRRRLFAVWHIAIPRCAALANAAQVDANRATAPLQRPPQSFAGVDSCGACAGFARQIPSRKP